LSIKLFYQDAYIKSFTSKILKQKQDKDGNWYIVLEETAFYPVGGGQPSDKGFLHNTEVIAVEEIDGEIRHYTSEPISEGETKVEGVIDWKLRFDHMQQHAGQHILSAAFEELFQYKTISFHLGKEHSTIDLDIGDLSKEDADAAEKLANDIILENRKIETKWMTAEEANRYPLRKELAVSDNVRLVIIPEFDYNGCGGTHPRSTGEVSSITILGWERQRKKIRVTFVCGNRVRKQLHQKQTILSNLTEYLNAPEKEMKNAVERLLEKEKETDKALEEAKEQLLSYEAKELAEVASEQIIGKVFKNRPITELQKLARYIVKENDRSVVVLVAENADKTQLVAARGEAEEVNMRNMMNDVLPLINGKGGGKESFVQGGGEASISGEELLQEFLKRL
jgi:alanyl-tRNA synthetase